MSEEKKRKTEGISRREFIKDAGFVVGGAAAVMATTGLLGCEEEAAKEPWLPEKWDKETDVVIAGAGGTGLVAAIEASEGGASVIVIEKAPLVGGTTKLSGGVIQASGTVYQRNAGVLNDTPDAHKKYWLKAAEGIANPELVKYQADNAAADIEWLVAQGIPFVSVYGVDTIPYIDPSIMVDRIHVPGGAGTVAAIGTGRFVVEPLYKVAQDKGTEFMLETTVTSLIAAAKNGVVGVAARSGNKDICIKTRKGVIIATSGFDHNEEMARAFSPQQLWALQTGSCAAVPTNTGDGIRMAMDIGANLTGLGGTIGVPATSIGVAPSTTGIWVNKYGQRFVNENSHYAYAMRAVFDREEHIAWAIFDAKVEGWSDDPDADIASGKVKTADTVTALAESIKVNAGQLQATLDKWNQDAASGADTVFLKQVGLAKIDTPPFYATQVTEWNLGSCGGLKINTKAQVLDVFDRPIPRLYAGGMAAGGIIGPYYPGSGTAIATTIRFGRTAGQNVALEEPWE